MTDRLRWIYLTTYPENKPVGMRTWHGDYRVDVMFRYGRFEYWCSECWNSGRDVYWTASRHGDDIFQVMADAEKWIRELDDALHHDYEEDMEGYG